MKSCLNCNKVLNQNQIKRSYCCSKCYHISRKGKLFPFMKKFIELSKVRNIVDNPAKKLETRIKMSNTRKRLFKIGKIKNWTTKGVSLHTRTKISNSIKNKWLDPHYRNKCVEIRKQRIKEGKIKTMFGNGKDNIAYVHGMSYLPYPPFWNNKFKQNIRNRYSNICIICENSDKKRIAVHHIDYNKNNCDISNLIPLCNSCHQKTNTRKKRRYYSWQFNIYKTLFG